MAKYIFGSRNDVHIIDLEETVKAIEEAYAFVRDVVARAGDILLLAKRSRPKRLSNEAKDVDVLYEPKMAGRNAHQFQDHSRRMISSIG